MAEPADFRNRHAGRYPLESGDDFIELVRLYDAFDQFHK
jgi:hypothetical protein